MLGVVELQRAGKGPLATGQLFAQDAFAVIMFSNCAQHVSAAASLRVGMHVVSKAFTVLRGVPQWSVVVVCGRLPASF